MKAKKVFTLINEQNLACDRFIGKNLASNGQKIGHPCSKANGIKSIKKNKKIKIHIGIALDSMDICTEPGNIKKVRNQAKSFFVFS